MTDWGRMLDRQVDTKHYACKHCGEPTHDGNAACDYCLFAPREDEINEPSVHDYCECCGGLPNECRCEIEGSYYSKWCVVHRSTI